MSEETDTVTTADDPPAPNALGFTEAELEQLSVDDLQDLADERHVAAEGTGQGGRVLKDDLIKALLATADLPVDPRQDADKHPLAAAAEAEAANARVRDRSDMFITDADQETLP